MVQALTNIANLQTILGIPGGDASQNALLNLYINEASQWIADWCGVKDFAVTSYTEALSGNNTPALALTQLPVQGVTTTGNTTSGSATITGLGTTTNLFVNQSVSGPGIPAGAILGTIGASQVTLVNAAGAAVNATATATGVPLAFGIAVWEDDNASGGDAAGAFAASTLLVQGKDYYLDWDQTAGGTCSSGLIYRVSGIWFRAFQETWGLISPQPGPPMKNVQVQYLAGYAPIPGGLQGACELLIANAIQAGVWGQNVQSLNNADMSVNLAAEDKYGLFTSPVRMALAKYRKIIVTG